MAKANLLRFGLAYGAFRPSVFFFAPVWLTYLFLLALNTTLFINTAAQLFISWAVLISVFMVREAGV